MAKRNELKNEEQVDVDTTYTIEEPGLTGEPGESGPEGTNDIIDVPPASITDGIQGRPGVSGIPHEVEIKGCYNRIKELENDIEELKSNWGNQVQELQAHIDKLEKQNTDLVFELQNIPEGGTQVETSNIQYKFPLKSWVNIPSKYFNLRFTVRQHVGISAGEPTYRLYQYETETELNNVHESELVLARNVFK